MSTTTHRCIVCGGRSRRAFKWSFEIYRLAYERKFRQVFPPEAKSVNYEMLRCVSCQLLFAEPQIPGDEGFYSWVTGMPNYYRPFRWEWDKIREYLLSNTQPQ